MAVIWSCTPWAQRPLVEGSVVEDVGRDVALSCGVLRGDPVSSAQPLVQGTPCSEPRASQHALSLHPIPWDGFSGEKPAAWGSTPPGPTEEEPALGCPPPPGSRASCRSPQHTGSLQGLLSEYFSCSVGFVFCSGPHPVGGLGLWPWVHMLPRCLLLAPRQPAKQNLTKVNSAPSPQTPLCLGFPSQGRPIAAHS